MRNSYPILLGLLLLCLVGSLGAQTGPTVRLTKATGAVGATACIDVVGENFDRISGMQFSIHFNPAFLEFTSASGNINGTNVSMINRSNQPEVIRVLYNPFSTTGYTDPGPFVIGQICFRVLQLGETAITIEDTPTPIEFTNEDQMVFGPSDVVLVNGVVNENTSNNATCSDGIQNGNETGIDCGGPDCAACPPTCSDGIQNGNETGVDCGGPDCAACPPTCSDGIQNGNETGVDCGGPDCVPCNTGGGSDDCGAGSDRVNLCVADVCDVVSGAQFCTDLTVSNYTDIIGFDFELQYPAANLDYVSFSSTTVFANFISANSSTDGAVTVVFFEAADAAYSLADNAVLGTVCFTAQTAATTTISATELNFGTASGPLVGPIGNAGVMNGNSCGTTTPTCSDGVQNGNETGVDCGGPDCAACPPTCSDGVQNGNETGVDCGGPDCGPCNTGGGGNDDCGAGSDRLNLCVADACNVASGEQFCTDLTVSNYQNIIGFDFELNYPAANLDYTSFSSTTPFANFISANATSDGLVTIVFFEAADAAYTLADNAVLGTVCFTAQTTAATTINATELNFGTASGPVVGPIGNAGTLNGTGCDSGTMPTCNDGMQNGDETGVDCGGSSCAPCQMTVCGDGTTDVEICVGSECADAGAEVCVPVVVGNFDDLIGLQFFLEFPAANLEFARATVHPSLQSGAQVTPPRMNGMNVDGAVRVIWNDPTLGGVTLAADEVAFEICFTAENTNATPITFQDPDRQLRAFEVGNTRVAASGSAGAVNQNCGDAMPTCSDGIMNGNETGIDCGGPDCAPCNNGGGNEDCGEGSDRLNVCIQDVCNVTQGSQFCVDMTVSNYTDIVGFDFSVTYPAANLDFVSFSSEVAFANAIQANGSTDGEVKFVFFIAADEPYTLMDNDVLGTLCFTAQTAATTTITPSDLSFGRTNGSVVGPIANPGTVNGNGCNDMGPSCSNGVQDGNETGIDCGGDCPTVCPTCNDGIMNGNETGIDCGGDCPTACPSCNDGIMNGDETGIDCGGSCTPCATNTVMFTAGNATGQIGQQVCVDVTVADFTNISDVGLTLNFDATNLSLASVTANPALAGFGAGNFNSATAGQVVVDYTPTAAQTLADGAVLFTVCFNVTGADEVAITLTGASVTRSGEQSLMVMTNDGVVNAGGVVEFTNLTLVAENVTAAAGTEVCVDITAFNLENLAALQFAIGYDPLKLEYSRAVPTGELQGLQAANPSPGTLRMLWFDQTVSPNSVDDGNSIVALCFNVLQACDADLPFIETSDFRTRATDANNQEVAPVDRIDGSVNQGVTCDDGPPPAANLVLEVGSASGTVGTEVCIDIDVMNFTSLTDLSFSLSYDPARVTFSGASNFGLSSITAANVTGSTTGTISFDWSAVTSTGQTIPSGGSLMTLCFTVNQLAITPIVFANAPTVIRARNASNQNVGVIPSGGAINPNAPVVDDLTFQIGSTTAAVGDEVCLPIIGFKATDLVSFQYSILYDANVLEYIGTGPDYAFNGFNNASVQNLQPGVLTVAWADGFAEGNSVQDGEALYTICFRVLSTELTLVSFSNQPTAIEFENVDDIVTAELLDGQVNGSQAPVILNNTITRPSCFGDVNGSISLNVSGGGNLSYRWMPNVSTGRTATDLAAGDYSVTVTNMSTGQNTSGNFTVPDGSLFALEVASVTGVSCFGDTDGRIVLSPTNGEGSLLYDWSGNLPDSGPQQTMLAGGSYSVTVTDGNGCARIQSNIMVGAPDQELRIIGSPNNIGDSGTGGVTIEIVGGRMPYRYSWTGPNGYTSTDEDVGNLTEEGTYCLTVTDNGGCTDNQCFAVVQALNGSAVVEAGCAGENNGAIDLTAAGATGGYSYRWTGPNGFSAASQDLDNLAPGDYTVTILSGMDSIRLTIEVDTPTPIDLTNVVVNAATVGNNGSITLTPSGGNSPYTFAWDDGVTTQNRTALSSGQYCVTVTDNSNCTEEACFTVNAMPISLVSVNTRATSCNDSADGSIDLVVNNGVAPFRVQVNPGGIDESFTMTNFSVNTPAGDYTILITDAQGGTLDATATVSSPDPISVAPVPTSDTEDMNCSGSIALNVSGGTGPYTIAWNNRAEGGTISQLCATDYVATVTDANGCTFTTDTITIGRIDTQEDNITEVACADGTDGGIAVTVSGGVAPYAFTWRRSGASTVLSTNEDLIAAEVEGGVTAGEYILSIQDATGAMLLKRYTVTVAAGFSVSVSVPTDYNGFDVSCADSEDGRIVVEISGQGSFNYEFERDGAMVGVDSVLENAPAGNYTVTVVDDGNCVITEQVVVTAPPAITIGGRTTDVSCGGTADGAITIEATGGVPSYAISWSTGEITPRISGLREGDYTATVTDANNCTETAAFTVVAPEDLAITFEATDADDGCNGTVRVIPLGGNPPYRISWPELPNQGNDPLAEGLCPGNYTIEVTDANGCQTVTMVASVLDRRFPCLSTRNVISPNGDGLNEKFVIFCSDGAEAINNTLQIFNRWGQRVYEVSNYNCSDDDRGTNCFEGRTNSGEVLPDGAYYYIFEFTNLQGDAMQQRGSISLIRE